MQLPYKKRNVDKSFRALQLVHTDVIVVNQKGRSNEHYILAFIDDFTSFKMEALSTREE